MAITPMDIKYRPFSVEFYTKIMLPDGIFDTAIKKQWINCFYKNISDATLEKVTIYLEGVGDPGIFITAHSHFFSEIKPGASVRVAWLADFEKGTPGKKTVSFIAQAKGMLPVRTLKNIFVSKTTYDQDTGEYTCAVDVGTIRTSKMKVIGPIIEYDVEHRPISRGPWLPSRMEMCVSYYQPYVGLHGDLPFKDPVWWKALAWIVFVIAELVLLEEWIRNKASGNSGGTGGTAIVSVKGGFDDESGEINCCSRPSIDKTATGNSSGLDDNSKTVAGIAASVAGAAFAVGCSDDADPWWRGQEATQPLEGEVTIAEVVAVIYNYPAGGLNPGEPYPVDVKWEYQRVTSGKTYTYSVEETQRNIHVNGGVEVDVPSVYSVSSQEPLIIKGKIKHEDGGRFSGEDLYAFAVLRSPDDIYFFVDLIDDGIEYDEQPNDGIYTGTIDLREIYDAWKEADIKFEGLWQLYVFAQDISKATPDMLPQIAAQHMGGFFVASSMQITFNPTLPCPLMADATITVSL
jgi:hypothetical protein